MRNRIYYYKLGLAPKNSPEAIQFIHEVIIVKAAYTSPTHIWINNVNQQSTERVWQKVPGSNFEWWWKWFKEVKSFAIKRKELTKTDLFEIIGLQNL